MQCVGGNGCQSIVAANMTRIRRNRTAALFLFGILSRHGDFFPLPYADGTITTL